MGSKTFIRRMAVSIMVCWRPTMDAPLFSMSIMPVASMVVEGLTWMVLSPSSRYR